MSDCGEQAVKSSKYSARFPRRAAALFALAVVCGFGGIAQAAPKLQVLFTFTNVRGANPASSLIADGAGNLYGAADGGTHARGLVFELSPPGAGKTHATETVLHSFAGADGAFPRARLTADAAGNLYGTTNSGGSNTACDQGCGVVFELSPPAPGKTAWTETVLYDLNGTGMSPQPGPLITDGAGNLYGATERGGANGSCEYGCGEVFELSPPAAGQTAWTPTVLETFGAASGYYPSGAMVADGAGNLFGTTLEGGANNVGAVFELTRPTPGGTWTESVLQAFDGTDGANPWGGLIADSAGNLYGTTAGGGAVGDGLVFELTPPAAQGTAWTETVLRTFDGTNGAVPYGTLLVDGAGDLYGTTYQGGARGDGVAFRLTPPPTGKTHWTETVMHSFCGKVGCDDGGGPSSGLIIDGAGHLYGTTPTGGARGEGVAFELTP